MRTKFYLSRLKNSIVYSFRNYKFRKDNYIGTGCQIHKSAILKGNSTLGANVSIGKNVVLERNVKIGSNTVLRNIKIGENSQIEGGVVVTGFGNGTITIGKECYIGIYNILDCSENITIGDFVHVAGPTTGLWTHSSAKMCINGDALDSKTFENRPTEPIIVESNVYIGGNCTIYPGVKISNHSIVAPNSVVNKNIESYVLVGGIPATVIKRIDG